MIAIAASSTKDAKGSVYYKGLVSLNTQYVGQSENQLRAGMTLQADIITGNKTILQYLLKPIYVTFNNAFYER